LISARAHHNARVIFSAIPTKSKGLALLLSSDGRFIEHAISELKTEILHLGASTDLKVSLSRGATTVLPTCCF
ncbi:MAG: hypothetical protein WB614_13925, partial [Pseudolabrys sp.]